MGKFTFRLFFVLFTFPFLSKKGTEIIAQTATQTFNYTGGNQTFVVPPCVTSITIQAWGGGGAGGGGDTYAGSDGGGGAYATSTIAVTPGTSLTIIVGGGGTPGGPCAGNGPGGAGGFGLGNGGNGGNSGSSGCSGPGGGGGGGTGVMNGATLLLVAGGGGGGGGGGNHGGGSPGGGGGQAGISGGSSAANGILGQSGTTVGLAGSNAGGADGAGGGGGGGGLNGGGGGHTPPTDNGGSGGAGGTSQGTTVVNGSASTPGNNGTLAGICSTCSEGGTATGPTAAGDPGDNGVLVISYNNPPPITGTIANSAGTCGVSTATVTPSGGTPGYTYTWSPIGGNAAASTNLTNGTYTVTIADANGCSGTANTTIAQPNALALSALTTSVNCNGLSTGSGTATAIGGTAPYVIGINSTPPQGGPTVSTYVANGLSAGSYTFGVQDAAGCLATFPITIAQPAALTVATTQTNVTCFGLSNGMAVATPAGGAGGYIYSWSPAGGATATANNLPAQTYTVLVTDVNSCTVTSTIDITQPALALTASAASTNITCNGAANGSATVTPGGGTTPYTYNWAPAGGTASIANNLTPQIYTVTVTDFNLCTATATVNITEPPVLSLTATTTSVTCFGLSNGSATATAIGGTGPTYTMGIIVPPQGGITTGIETFSGLAAGIYTVGVQDVNGCQAIFPITINQPAVALSSTTTQTNVTCFGLSTGDAMVTAGGGTSPYTYSWSPSGGTGTVANNLSAQPYTVTVTDLNLCTTTSTLTITQPPLFSASITTSTNVSCFGLSDGGASGTQTGGTMPYTYNWTPTGGTTTTASNLPAQIYTLTVTDANLCPATATVNITQPALLILTATTTPVTCFGLSTGSATATATGGTPSYTMGILAPPQGGITATGIQAVNGLTAGNYTFGVQDANGCQAIFPITITQPPALTLTATETNVSCNGLSNGSATATVTGGTGPIYTVAINSTPPQGSITTGVQAVSGLSAGNYTFGAQDANGCQDTLSITITQPALLTESILTSTNVSCYGGTNGSATATSMGGTTPYSYSWNTTPIQPDSMANGLPAGNYTATVTDAHGCMATTFTTITQPPVLTVLSTPKTICISNSTTLTANAGGGTQPYTYLWSDGTAVQTDVVNPTTTQSYTYTVTDAKGCTTTNTVIVNVRNPLNFIAVSPAVEMCNGFTANLNATGSGGDSTFTYIWNPAGLIGQNVTVQPSVTTTYTVTLLDACGTPSVTSTVDVIIDPLPKVTFASDKQSGCYPLCVNFASTPVPQAPAPNIVSYAWNLGSGYSSTAANPSQCYTKPGVYAIEVTTTSDKNCISRDSIFNMITVYNHPVADFTYLPDPANILAPTIQFTDISTAPGSYIKNVLWQTFGDGSDSTSTLHNPAHIYQDTGTFCVKLIATNGFGCKDTNQQCIVIKPYFTLYVPNAFSPNGDGINDIFLAIGEYVETFDMRIFDRWGNEIYFTGDITKGWNGGAKGGGGTIAKEDVYVYMITATDALRKSHSYKGTITLIK